MDDDSGCTNCGGWFMFYNRPRYCNFCRLIMPEIVIEPEAPKKINRGVKRRRPDFSSSLDNSMTASNSTYSGNQNPAGTTLTRTKKAIDFNTAKRDIDVEHMIAPRESNSQTDIDLINSWFLIQ